MSTWGIGNFENDRSWGMVEPIIDELIDTIQRCLADPEENLTCGEGDLMPSVDILVTLGRAYPNILFKLREQPVTEWKKMYLRMYEEQSEFSMEHEFQSKRKDIIAETFSNLEELVLKFKNEPSGFEE
jgi:hypothetical protein